jgi:hypothetical protein
MHSSLKFYFGSGFGFKNLCLHIMHDVLFFLPKRVCRFLTDRKDQVPSTILKAWSCESVLNVEPSMENTQCQMLKRSEVTGYNQKGENKWSLTVRSCPTALPGPMGFLERTLIAGQDDMISY